jgi:hypothetical protein
MHAQLLNGSYPYYDYHEYCYGCVHADGLCEQAQVNCTFSKIGQTECRNNSTMEAVAISISCNGCYTDIMFGNISCISDTFQLSEAKDCYQYNFTHNQTLCKYTVGIQILASLSPSELKLSCLLLMQVH